MANKNEVHTTPANKKKTMDQKKEQSPLSSDHGTAGKAEDVASKEAAWKQDEDHCS